MTNRLLLACYAFLTIASAVQVTRIGDQSAYFWPHARGSALGYSTTGLVAPGNLNSSLSWSWHHPEGTYHTVLVGAPLIDDERSIYISSEDGVRKFSHEGEMLWRYAPRGPVSSCPSLMSGALFGNTVNGWVFALDMTSGKEVWAAKKAENIPDETGYVESHEGIVVTGVDSGVNGGATRILGLNATDGSTVWEFNSSHQLRNVMPVFTGDSAFLVMDIHGGLVKHSLHNDTLLWRADPPKKSEHSSSEGGVMIGPDDTAFTCSNYEGSGKPGDQGVLRAYESEHGMLLWERVLDYPCNSWPAVTPNGQSVIVPTGASMSSAASGDVELMWRFRRSPRQMQDYSLSLGNSELDTYGQPVREAAVLAFNAQTGESQWSTELPMYGRLAARGDEEGYLQRKKLHHRDQCLPTQLTAPTISGDGTVYVGRADGLLYAVKRGNYTTFDAAAGFMHPGTAWAPGMMAVASCDGLFVWKF